MQDSGKAAGPETGARGERQTEPENRDTQTRDCPERAAGPPVDGRDSVSAVLGEVALRVTDNEQVGKEHEAHRSEMTAIDMPIERRGSIVILPLYHLLDGHDRDVSASAVLQEFRIV